MQVTINWLFQKKTKQERGGRGRGGGHKISIDIEKTECGNSNSECKKEVKFPGVIKKNHVEFSRVLDFGLRNSVKTQFCRISRDKFKNSRRLFQKSISSSPAPLFEFFWNSRILTLK